MLIAFLSDLHGNLPALEAAVADARARRAGQIIVAGDITGYGPFPDGVCCFLEEGHIQAIRGNYDQKVLDVIEQGKNVNSGMKKKKQEILLWTVKHLSEKSQRYLSGLPTHIDMQLAGGKKLLVVHGSPISMDDAIYPSITKRGLEAKLGDANPDILVCGHTHIPFLRHIGGILVVNCGSAGHPVDGDPRPSYALINTARGVKANGRIIRFDYNKVRTIKALKKTSLHKGLRKDFSKGSRGGFCSDQREETGGDRT